MRAFRHFLYFFVGVMLSAVSILSYADSYPRVSGWKVIGSSLYFSSAVASCQAYTYLPDFAYSHNVASDSENEYCYAYRISNPAYKTSSAQTVKGFYCPAGGTLSGISCINVDPCPSGNSRDPSNGQCVDSQVCYAVYVTVSGSCLKPAPCVPGQLPGIATTSQALCADNKPDPNSGCPPGGIVIGRNAAGKPLCLSPPPSDSDCTSAGGTIVGTIGTTDVCSKSVNPKCADGSNSIGVANGTPVCQDTCPAGQATGTMNGVTSCWPVGKTSTGTASNKTSTNTNTPAGGSTTTTGSTSTTVCNAADSCTTTTVNTTNGSATGTSTSTQSRSAFCAANPTDANCANGTTQTREVFCAEHPLDTTCVTSSKKATCDPTAGYCGSGSATGLYTTVNDSPIGKLTADVQSFNASFLALPFASAMTGFFNVTVPSGSCPSWSATIPYFNHSVDLSPYFCTSAAQNMMQVAGAVLMIVAAFAAYRWAVL